MAGPSFELFYQSDYLLPHRHAAWALLEERIREAAALAELVKSDGPPDVASRLDPIARALLGLARTLATCRSEWAGKSHTGEATAAHRTEVPRANMKFSADERPSFAAHIQPLFRPRDRQSMAFAFDLWAYEAVKENAQAILDRLRAGTMPCDGPWPEAKIALLQRWIDGGTLP
jgi:hypothetical protein